MDGDDTRPMTTDDLPDHANHSLVTSSRVINAPVFDKSGERIGRIDDLSIDKVTGQVRYALVAFGGFLGIGEQIHPTPWAILDYNTDWDGYVTPLDLEALKAAPAYTHDELAALGGGDSSYRDRLFAYYGPYGAAPYWG
jgi:hypothetical protein